MCCHNLSLATECCIYLLFMFTSWQKGILPCAPLIKSLSLCWPPGTLLPYSHPWEGQSCPMQCSICWEEANCGWNNAGKVASGPEFAAGLPFISSAAGGGPGQVNHLTSQSFAGWECVCSWRTQSCCSNESSRRVQLLSVDLEINLKTNTSYPGRQ